MIETMEAYPDIDGVFCTNADTSDLYLGLEQEEEDAPLMIGVDATTKQQEAVKDDREYGIVSRILMRSDIRRSLRRRRSRILNLKTMDQ